ncbi:MAG: adenosylcobinamide-phosphate synthase CbiB [Nitrospiraceae bacterium]|nr:adenosylcobinamide-phosphate synthase CbiB [Nitrospiraceae bacterium]
MHRIAILGLALAMDLAMGEPRWFFLHPVRIIGRAVEALERFLRGPWPRMGGILLCVAIVFGTYAATAYLANALDAFSRRSYLGTLVLAFLLYTTIALRGLTSEGTKIISLVASGDIETARRQLKSLVGRDTENLDEGAIMKATVESLAENASDGVLAPVFYYLLGGLPLAMTYKAINTMDSMVGYRNERYRLFGWAAARLDDLANFIPARLTGFFICLTSAAGGNGFLQPLMTMLRDGRKHPSPNSGVPMAAMAGALGVTLGGPASYGGVLVEKPFMGAGPPPLADEAKRAVKLTLRACLLGALAMALASAALFHWLL